MSKKSKNALLDKISVLTYQNKKLKEENANLLALQSISKFEYLLPRVCQNAAWDITSKLADNTLPQIRANVDEKSNVRHKQCSSIFSFGIKETNTELLDIAQDETKTNYYTAVECNKENILSSSGSIEYKSETKSVLQSDKVQLAENIFIDKYTLKNSDHSSVKKLTNDLLLHVFGSETLAVSSVTGKLPNLYSRLPEGQRPKVKPMLDHHKLNACKDYVLKRFPNEKNAEKEFCDTTKRKCNNAVRRRVVKTIPAS
ncbi:uncharacterized protein LOC143894366 [Temnothorax americanus]|uniref:uncharacterized protein LOC143894366 n=1 Tax=Temnothorax americanus TaxID=1964332 RepID=UPI004067C7AE